MAKIHLKTAWHNIRRSPFQALAAVFILAVTFFVATILSIIIYASGQALNYFETRPQVIAFLKDDVTAEQVSSLQAKLIADSRVKDVHYVSREEALEIYKAATSDNPLLSELVSPTIFPASLEFSLKDLSFADSVIGEIQEEEIVDQVGFTASIGFGRENIQGVVDRLRAITFYIRVGGGAFAGLLVGTSFLVLLVIISIRMSTRRQEVEILDLIGATPGFIRSPIIAEALIYAFVGVLIGWAASLVLVLYATPSVISYFGEIPVIPKDTLRLMYLFGVVLAIELAVGFLLALAGSLFAVSRARRRR
ncbi:MAG: cell division protein FtsX [Patescibacteria group bacterium]